MSRFSLIVEDHDQVRRLLHQILARLDFDVLEAESEEEGFHSYIENAPQIEFIFLDHYLAAGNGYRLYQKIRELNPFVPIVLSSATPETEMETAIHDPHTNYLLKPFSIKQLIEATQINKEDVKDQLLRAIVG